MTLLHESAFLIVSAVLVVARDMSTAVMESSLKLELVQVNFRHGIRTPIAQEARYVNVTDPSIYGPQGFGQLTNDGKYQSYKLGQLLRKQYDVFLGNYEPEKMYAYTSKYDRTKMTVQLVIAGLYPPLDEDKWHPTLQWRPIPFETAASKFDVLTTPHQCAKYKQLFQDEINRSKEYKSEMAKYNDLFDYMEKTTGQPFRTNIMYHAGYTFYAVKIHKLMNLPLPEWSYDETLVKRISEVLKYNLDAQSMTQKLKKLNGGTMVRQVIENIETNRKAEKPKKLYLYSHHDITLAAFTRAQKLVTFDIPPFGSAIIMEKYRDDKNIEYIRFLTWDGDADEFYAVRLKGCEQICPYQDYLRLVKDVIPTDEELEYLVSGH